jgi:hypothetical protein
VSTLAGVDVEARIRELVDRHRPELEELVDAELDRQLDVIVGERIAIRNGTEPVVPGAEVVNGVDHFDPVPGPKVSNGVRHFGLGREPLCAQCGQRPRLADRSVCRTCKTTRDREHRHEKRAIASDREPP